MYMIIDYAKNHVLRARQNCAVAYRNRTLGPWIFDKNMATHRQRFGCFIL